MLESAPAMGIRLENLKPEVRSYVQKLRASLQVVYDRYQVANRDELAVKVRKGEVEQEDIDKALGLIRKMNECGRKNETPFRMFEMDLMESETKKLSDFFERPIGVTPLPKEITAQMIEQWEKQRLELHYLPDIDMSNERHLANWKKQPNLNFVKAISLPNGVMRLTGGWVLVDARPKPDEVGSEYENDQAFLGPVLEKLRKIGLIANFENPRSRFAISADELQESKVVAAIAETCGLKLQQDILPRMIEFNVLGNIHHPEWGETRCGEWFADGFRASGYDWHLNGGSSDQGGLSFVYYGDDGDRSGKYGFRVLGRFN